MLAERDIQVLVLDGQRLFREGLRTVLERAPGLHVQHAADCLEEALESGQDPDIAVVDPFAPPLVADGLKLLRDLIRLLPNSKVLVLSQLEDPEVIQQSLAAGALGYVHKDASVQDLVDAVRKVALGQDYLHASLGVKLMRHLSFSDREDSRLASLTPTEQEVLRVLALGHTNSEAATMLCYSMRTVEAYRSRLMKKLGADTRAQLVKIAAELNLLYFDSDQSGSVQPLDTVPGRSAADFSSSRRQLARSGRI